MPKIIGLVLALAVLAYIILYSAGVIEPTGTTEVCVFKSPGSDLTFRVDGEQVQSKMGDHGYPVIEPRYGRRDIEIRAGEKILFSRAVELDVRTAYVVYVDGPWLTVNVHEYGGGPVPVIAGSKVSFCLDDQWYDIRENVTIDDERVSLPVSRDARVISKPALLTLPADEVIWPGQGVPAEVKTTKFRAKRTALRFLSAEAQALLLKIIEHSRGKK